MMLVMSKILNWIISGTQLWSSGHKNLTNQVFDLLSASHTQQSWLKGSIAFMGERLNSLFQIEDELRYSFNIV